MLDVLFNGSFMPHGHCLLWRWDLLFLHVAGDALTAISYALIPIALIHLVHHRDDLKFDKIFLLFAGFIAFCGITHVMGLINIWHGYYYLEGLTKLTTGIISITTAFVLWKLVPKILAVPSSALLEQRNAELLKAQDELKEINATLEAKIEERTRELHVQANTDPLTSISNRRAILCDLEKELLRSHRYKLECSILMLDVDYFKQVNDTYGHQVGDEILVKIAETLVNSCRTTDNVGRYGGEEFLIVLPQTDKLQAYELAERIRINVASLTFVQKWELTCSIGVANLLPQQDIHQFIKQADDAVYKAKNAGRNRVVCAD
ncbi:GGDEF domain-containing protein [Aliiglaciecola lipolytica]|uniref:diguanylate cyclase n=1 Tax=Aliiglaciecola lipolytica E3 TaxID=1127673 RepID=K6Y560_9ALTE|nr:GGDEF domain-containing protein [Aliiglaciecola lipolytica]GAC13377.1 bacteriophytochrome [Aliiglaciecola lipolytica E3]